MPAICKCVNGHTWTARVIEDDPDTNSFIIEPDICPECDTTDFTVLSVEEYDTDFHNQ